MLGGEESDCGALFRHFWEAPLPLINNYELPLRTLLEGPWETGV